MKITKQQAIDLMSCMEQINLHYRYEKLLYDRAPPKGALSIFHEKDMSAYYLTDDKNDLEKRSPDFNDFLEEFYYLLIKGRYIRYSIQTMDEGYRVRFNGSSFILYDGQKVIDDIPFSDFDQELRREYFEREQELLANRSRDEPESPQS